MRALLRIPLVGTSYRECVAVDKTISYEEAAELMTHFEKKGYITKSGKIKDSMKYDLLAGTLDLPPQFEVARKPLENIISRANKIPPIRDASRDVMVRLNKKAILAPEFLDLWDKIKQKTVYRVQIDTEKLVADSVKQLAAMPPIPKTRLVSQTADINIRYEGVTHTEREMRATDIQEEYAFFAGYVGDCQRGGAAHRSDCASDLGGEWARQRILSATRSFSWSNLLRS